MVDYILFFLYINKTRRGVEQLAARRAHNPEAAGSSPAPAIEGICFLTGVFFVLNGICSLTVQDSKRSERRPNREEKAAGRPPAVSADAWKEQTGSLRL